MATLREHLKQVQVLLAAAGIPDPRLETELLLTDLLQLPRHHLYALQDQELPSDKEAALKQWLDRRRQREPLAYILGHREFYGIDLLVGPAVMVPRPETELLVEQAMLMGMERMDEGAPVMVDVGTGCGGIAINLALHLPRARTFATDLSPEALQVAAANIQRHKVGSRITLLQGDLLEPVPGPVDVIVANLPYIPSSRIAALQPEVQQEPRSALDGGPDGLAVIRRLLHQAQGKLASGGVILLEIDPGQASPLEVLAQQLFPGAIITVEQDLARLDRIFILQRG